MSVDLEKLRELLNDPSSSPALPMVHLYHFSDLTAEHLVEFCATWDTLPTAQRRHLARSLLELAEANFEVNFDAIFAHALYDADAEVRAIAIDGLWENQDMALIGPLLAMLRSDPSPRVRAAAASSLGRYVLAGELEQIEAPVHARIMTELLTTLYLAGESIQVRRRVIESVAYACTPEIREVLENAYDDEDEQMRISAVMGMGRSCERRWQEILLQELDSASPAMRYEAAWACGELELQQAVPIMARLINDPDRQVCNATIWALGQIGGAQAKQILIDAFEDADEDTQEALDDALAEQVLAEGDIDFLLYALDGISSEDLFDEEFLDLLAEDDEDEDELLDDWPL